MQRTGRRLANRTAAGRGRLLQGQGLPARRRRLAALAGRRRTSGISVHPDFARTANTIYCAFTRLFGATKKLAATADDKLEAQLKPLEAHGYTVIPPSGKLRDLTAPTAAHHRHARLPHPASAAGQSHAHDLRAVRPVRQPLRRAGPDGHRSRRWSSSTSAPPAWTSSAS